MNKKPLIAIVIVLAVVLAAVAAAYRFVPEDAADERYAVEQKAVRETVEGFGKRIQNVPLSGTDEAVAKAIVENYSAFVSPSLVTEWAGNPKSAPGRLASSPWPDRIEITGISRSSDGTYRVSGKVAEITSLEAAEGGIAASYPVEMSLKLSDASKWEIVSFLKGEYEQKARPGFVTVRYDDIQLERPQDSILQTGEGLGGGRVVPSLFKISFPRTTFGEEKTNFSEAYLVVGKSTSTPGCVSFSDVPDRVPGSATGSKAVNGAVWQSLKTAEAAAGNLYESRLYRLEMGGACYEASLTLRTGNLGNYPPESGIREFDKEKAFSIMERVFETVSLSQ